MPRSDAGLRRERYEIKRKVSMVPAYENMVKVRQPRVERLAGRAELDTTVAGILNNHGIPANDRIKYHNFARKIEKLKRTGTLVDAVVQGTFAYFEAIGCDRAVLEDIFRSITGGEA